MTMPEKAQAPPPAMACPATGETLRRDTQPFTVRYKGQEKVVDLPGYYPDGDGESMHVGADMAAADAALRLLKEQVDGVPSPTTIRRIRHKLRLSQRAAGDLFRVVATAFDKYERNLWNRAVPPFSFCDCSTHIRSWPRKSVRPAGSSRWSVRSDRPAAPRPGFASGTGDRVSPVRRVPGSCVAGRVWLFGWPARIWRGA
jgi:HTH-type transcriptional regulator / antitoxin MqsA